MYVWRAMPCPRPAVRVAASAPRGLCATAINASAGNSNPDEGNVRPTRWSHVSRLGSARLGFVHLRPVLFDVLHIIVLIVLVTRLHAIYCWCIFAIWDDRCMHVGGVLSGADLISLDIHDNNILCSRRWLIAVNWEGSKCIPRSSELAKNGFLSITLYFWGITC